MELAVNFEERALEIQNNPLKNNWSVVLEPSNDLGGLYLGNLRNAKDPEFFKTQNITVVLNLTGFKCHNPEIAETKILDIRDQEDFDMTVYYQECFDFIHQNRMNGKNVFIHCICGISRSPSIVIGYLMKTLEMDLDTAFQHVKTARKRINPNSGFKEQLMNYEKILKKEKESLVEMNKELEFCAEENKKTVKLNN